MDDSDFYKTAVSGIVLIFGSFAIILSGNLWALPIVMVLIGGWMLLTIVTLGFVSDEQTNELRGA